jgi:hypothetical protein
MVEKRPSHKLQTGFIVFGTLAGIKIIEYAVSRFVPAGDFLYLLVLAFISAGFIMHYYKHIGELFNSKNKENDG